MKNKKLLTRIFALLASLVLVVALAVPCFADTRIDDTDYVINSITFTDGNSAYEWLINNADKCIRAVARIASVEGYVPFDSFFYAVSDGEIIGVHGSNYYGWIYNQPFSEITTECWMFDIDANVLSFTVSPIRTDIESGVTPSVNGLPLVELPHDQWSLVELTLTCEYVTEYIPEENTNGGGGSDDGDGSFVPIQKEGLFGQLYYILKEAIYGNVVIGTSQEFALAQVTQYLVLATVLLPLIFVVIITFKMLR